MAGDRINCCEGRLVGPYLNEWVKKFEVDSGRRAGIPTEMAERMKALERENRELRQANEILRVFEEKWRVNGVRKVWRQLGSESFDVARCTAARLMKVMGIQGLPEQAAQDDDPRQTAVSARQGEPSGSRACTKHAVGVGFHLWCASPQSGRHMTGMQRERRMRRTACPLL